MQPRDDAHARGPRPFTDFQKLTELDGDASEEPHAGVAARIDPGEPGRQDHGSLVLGPDARKSSLADFLRRR